MAHRRLRIIDLVSGQQPMESPDGQVCVVFNGEIYNYPELKKDLEHQGYVFRSRSDTEVLLALYMRDGIEAFVDAWERQPIFASHAALPPSRIARIRRVRLDNSVAGLAASLRAAGQGAMEPLHDRLHAVLAPTLVIAGALDAAGRARAESIAAAMPGARLEIIDGAGHTPHEERPLRFRRLALEFLEEDPAA